MTPKIMDDDDFPRHCLLTIRREFGEDDNTPPKALRAMKVHFAHEPPRAWNWFVGSVPSLSLVWLILFYSYCLRVRLALGHWPTSISEDGGLGSAFHYHAGFLMAIALLAFTPLWSIAVIAWAVFVPELRNRWTLSCLVVPWLVYLFVRFVDPHRLFVWYCD